ncbi:class I SAM-dependent methyltransferase [Streptomyces nitrosporeus]|uniref:Class I SAM-dependent methyltransferase n=1 Tax=Streptomyces nitrosporeus TaxID=28894 RepID=A0A5J6FJH8_9ACTN|nr:class I SAM-dependent methyltransferase [Streptomyces nitrosporeus]QEU76373.1 class I SAM-dependent methyltransferase [Streptomyces nitrosporeus]GGZ16201.1 SAM-dependent methyltransferase [Streptomyces nitrosporeus]
MSEHTAHSGHGQGHGQGSHPGHGHGGGHQGTGHGGAHGGHQGAGHGGAHGHAHDTGDFDWDVMGPLLEQEAELSRPQYEGAARWIAALPTAPEVRRILDIGSGPGVVSCLLAEVFPDAEVVAVDGTPALLERARARAERLGLAGRVRTVHAELPQDIGSLDEADLVWAGNTLHHIGDQRAALAALAQRLRPGGTLALAEGGLTARHLPRDTGLGRPGLETRLEAVREGWFDEMRDALPGAVRETEDWSGLFRAVGLEAQGTRSFLLDLPAPLPEAALDRVVADFTRKREVFAERLDAQDIAALDRLTDPADPAGIRRRGDVFMLSVRTVHLGRRAPGTGPEGR